VRVRRVLPVAVGLVIAVSLCGCVAGSSTPPKSTPTPTATSALNTLLPVLPSKLTAATAKSETVRVADGIDALVANTDILYVDNHAQLVPKTKTAGSYYGVLRTISVDSKLDPLEQAEAMEKLLVTAGWIERDSATDKGKYLAAMSSSRVASQSWFLLLGGDSTNAKSPVVTVQVASPDLP
jgi:hypothetical protein